MPRLRDLASNLGRATLIVCASVVVVASSPRQAAAGPILNTVDRGWYNQSGTHTATNQNYIVGSYAGILYRDFFVFDLSGVTDPITAAILELQVGVPTDNDPDVSGAFSVFDVTTSLASLTAGTGGVAAYNDLGSGILFGGIALDTTVHTSGSIVQISLNTAGLNALNAATGLLALGGAMNSGGHFFSYTSNPETTRLVLTTEEALTPVPEPTSLLLLGSGIAGISAKVRQRRRQQAQ